MSGSSQVLCQYLIVVATTWSFMMALRARQTTTIVETLPALPFIGNKTCGKSSKTLSKTSGKDCNDILP